MYHQAGNEFHKPNLAAHQSGSDWRARFEYLRGEIDALQAQLVQSSPKIVCNDVDAMIQARRLRQRFFKEDLFADPAWDILLELYSCELAQRRISVSKLSYAINAPATTVLRWIAILEREGHIVRTDDPMDRRRVWISLSSTGSAAMSSYFASIG